MQEYLKVTLYSSLIFIISWLFTSAIGVNDLAIQSEDTLPAMFIPVSIVKDKTLYADNYYEMIRARYPHPDDKEYTKDLTPFYFRKVGTHYISAFPLITGFLALPVFLLPLLFGMAVSWSSLIALSHISAAIIVGLSGGFLYLLAKKHLVKDKSKARLLTFIYLFGTINYALVSQALWQHGAVQLFFILTLLAIYEKRYFASGLFLGLSLLSRPTAFAAAPFLILILISQIIDTKVHFKRLSLNKSQLKALAVFVVGLSLAFLFFAYYTSVYYSGLENNGYSDQIFVGWLSRFPEGFLGLWLSPSKGILVYSPIFLFSFVGVFKILKSKKWKLNKNFIYLVSLAIVVTHTLILGRWKHWYGGWSFGYRMAADVLPFLVLSLVPFVTSDLFNKYKKFFFGVLVVSVFIQIFGIIFFDGVWHAAYDLGYENTSWLWSIRDSELVFNIRRILVKLGYLQQACPACL